MKVQIILNPYANRWGARAMIPEITTAFEEANLDYNLVTTSVTGHGKQLAAEAVSNGFEVVVAAGGDGTVSEVVNGLIEESGDEPTIPMAVVPIGTGNDFSDMNGLSRNLKQAVEVVATGQVRRLDAGMVTVDGHVYYFDNNCALAMEPLVTLENIRMTWLSGNVRYLAALLKAVLSLRTWQMQMDWGEGVYEGQTLLLSVCNSPRTGGLFTMAPGASMEDGRLDLVIAPKVGKVAIVPLLVQLLRAKHINDPRITHRQVTRVDIRCASGTPVHADGEIVSESANEIKYEILPGKISLLTPRAPSTGSK